VQVLIWELSCRYWRDVSQLLKWVWYSAEDMGVIVDVKKGFKWAVLRNFEGHVF